MAAVGDLVEFSIRGVDGVSYTVANMTFAVDAGEGTDVFYTATEGTPTTGFTCRKLLSSVDPATGSLAATRLPMKVKYASSGIRMLRVYLFDENMCGPGTTPELTNARGTTADTRINFVYAHAIMTVMVSYDICIPGILYTNCVSMLTTEGLQ